MLTIGVDVGGTKVAAGLVDGEGNLLNITRRATPSYPDDVTAAVLDAVRTLSRDVSVAGVGLAVPGFVSADQSTLLLAPNIPGWRNVPLQALMQQETGLPVIVENDANAAAWGEAVHGAGRGEADLVCITVGTGIGGGVILEGRLLRGRWGFAAEIGHMQVDPKGRPCGCGQRGCWEQYANGAALLAEAQHGASVHKDQARVLLAHGDGTPGGITPTHVTAAAHQGDPVALAAFETLGGWLGQGLANLAAVLDPGCFILGGGVSDAGEILLGPTRSRLETALTAGVHRPLPEVKKALLGNNAGMIGAAALAAHLPAGLLLPS